MIERQHAKEESAIVLDFLPHGYPFDKRPMHMKTPIVQAIGKKHFVLLELIPKKGIFLQPLTDVYIGEGKREEIHHISCKLLSDKLTQTAKLNLENTLKKLVEESQEKFIEFFNKSGPINTRMHQIELLPGIGKKHMWEIIEQRKEEPFKNFEDIKQRIKLIPDPEKLIIKRILLELEGSDKHRLFVDS
ncbi:DUF655 domain-containing protein [Candidatus Woesearchaeota archaeon]|nr:DUF655 domain-containing protein [Candidatus Woesearchaeota archaeon]